MIGRGAEDSLRASLHANLWKVQAINFFWMFLLIMPIIVPYLNRHGLGMQQVYILQTVFNFAVVLLEVPSGYLSDHLGRKKTLLMGGFFAGVAFTIFSFARTFPQFIVFEIFAALGASLYSGTDVALVYDTAEALEERATEKGNDAGASVSEGHPETEAVAVRPRDEAIAVLGKRLFYSQTGETAAAIIGGLLVLVSIQLPATINAITAWIPFFIVLTIQEPPRRLLHTGGSHSQRVAHLFRLLFVESPLLRLIMLNLIVYGLGTLVAVWAFQGNWESQEIPLRYFGYLWAAYNLTVALVGRIAHQIERRIGSALVVLFIGLLPVVGYFGMAQTGAVLGVLFGLTFQVGRGLTQVVLRDALNVRVPTDYRATANSISTLGVRLCFALLGPLMGLTIDRQGYTTAFHGFGIAYAVLFVVVCLPLVRMRREFRPTS